MQACMDGFEIVSPYKNGENTGETKDINKRLLATTDLIVTTTGNLNVCDSAMLKMLKRHNQSPRLFSLPLAYLCHA
jgi:adenosylhomocysteinase